MPKPRKLTVEERELLCGCGFCSDGQNWGYCQYTEDRLTEKNEAKLKEARKKLAKKSKKR